MYDGSLQRRFFGVASLSVAAISSLVGVAFVGIAFSTDNWKHISVVRARLLDQIEAINDTKMMEDFYGDVRYFDRVEGMFRMCFPMFEKPKKAELYMNPVDEWCANIEYYMQLLEYDGLVPDKMTSNAQVWIHTARATIAAFILYFMFAGIACGTGFCGCWQVSGDRLITTAIIKLFAFLFGAAGMVLFHVSHFYELNKVFDERMQFFQTWPHLLRENTEFSMGWSYIFAWIGILLTLLSSIMYAAAAIAIKLYWGETVDYYRRDVATHAREAADHYEDTLKKHGNSITLTAMRPMEIKYIQHAPVYPGYVQFPQVPGTDPGVDPRTDPKYAKHVADFYRFEDDNEL